MTHTSDGIPYTGPTCPIPIKDYPRVLLAHGGGGRLMRDLIEQLFSRAFGPDVAAHDCAILESADGPIAMTTDSFVVSPIQFPGGDIGSLAVHGTVNDLAMGGARPRWLTAGFILEEGLAMDTLWQVACSMAAAAREAGVQIVTGDTKVVERGRCDGVYINTAGVGFRIGAGAIGPDQIQPGDAILLNGDVGRHGIAIMGLREGLAFENEIQSDSAPVVRQALAPLEAGLPVHCMRDLTRGGLATALVELARAAGLDMTITADAVPVLPAVQAVCEILGLDPLYVANEGRFITFVPESVADQVCGIHREAGAPEPVRIGTVTGTGGDVGLRAPFGSVRILDMLSGEQLPRIC